MGNFFRFEPFPDLSTLAKLGHDPIVVSKKGAVQTDKGKLQFYIVDAFFLDPSKVRLHVNCVRLHMNYVRCYNPSCAVIWNTQALVNGRWNIFDDRFSYTGKLTRCYD